jgi:hypothetical protein
MAENQDPKKEPIRLVDEDDRSLTFLNTDVENGDVNTKMNTDEGLEEGLDEHPLAPGFEEETAAEFPAVTGARPFADEEERETTEAMNIDDTTAGRGVGTFAIVLSILSLFFLPVLLGAAGIVVGFVARRYGSTSLGNWAIGIGAISILMTVFFSPFF